VNVIKIEGPRASGKTSALKNIIDMYARANPDARILIAAPNHNMIRSLMPIGHKHVYTVNNNSIRGARGVRPDLIVLEELSYLDHGLLHAVALYIADADRIAYSLNIEQNPTDELNTWLTRAILKVQNDKPTTEQGILF